MNTFFVHRRTTSRRRGITLAETLAAAVLLVIAMSIVAQVSAAYSRQYRRNQQRSLAIEELANIMEQVRVLPWNDLQQSRLSEFVLPEALIRLGGDPQLTPQLELESGAPSGKRVCMSIDWAEPSGDRSRPIQLTAWRFQPAEAQP